MNRAAAIIETLLGVIFLIAAWCAFYKYNLMPHQLVACYIGIGITAIHLWALRKIFKNSSAPMTLTRNCSTAFWLLLFLTVLPINGATARYALSLIAGFNGTLAIAAAAPAWAWKIIGNIEATWKKIEMIPSERFAVGIFALGTAIYVMGSLKVFQGIPHIEDGIAQLFQARIFASGHISVAPPLLPEFFDFPNMILKARWYCQYPPGWSLLLAVGVLAGTSWVVNPIMGALTAVVTYKIGDRVSGEQTGRLAAILTLISPFFYFLAASFMNHTSTAFFLTLFTLFYLRFKDSGKVTDGLVAGLALGYAILIRPLTAFGYSLPFAVYTMISVVRLRRLSVGDVLMAISALAGVGALLAYNRMTNGSALSLGYTALHGAAHNLGFGMRGLKGYDLENFTPAIGVANMFHNFGALSKHLYEWPFPGLVFAVVAVAFASRDKVKLWLLGASCATLGVAYIFFFFHQLALGPRFLLEITPALCVLTAQGIILAPSLIEGRWAKDMAAAKRFVGVALTLAYLWAVMVNMPPLLKAYSHNFWNVTPDLDSLVRKQLSSGDKALVFIEGDENYGSGFLFNTPALDGRITYARDLGERDRLLISQYPDRKVFAARLDLRRGIIGVREMTPSP